MLAFAISTKTAVVLATTGLSDEQIKEVEVASEKIAVFFSYNMSLGVSLLCELSKTAAKILGTDFDVEIVEAHHIEYFSQTQNNDSSNIIVLCPNCHRLIHKCDPIYHKKELCFEFGNGKKISVKNPGHLK